MWKNWIRQSNDYRINEITKTKIGQKHVKADTIRLWNELILKNQN